VLYGQSRDCPLGIRVDRSGLRHVVYFLKVSHGGCGLRAEVSIDKFVGALVKTICCLANSSEIRNHFDKPGVYKVTRGVSKVDQPECAEMLGWRQWARF
jgi:hypothetical protein